MRETATVRLLRAGFRMWPIERGRGWLLRLSRLLCRTPVTYNVGADSWVETNLDDWMALWTFMCRHEADQPFQRSLQLIPAGGVAVDVGANIGVWSLLAAERSAATRVYAFEPVPSVAAHFRRHLELNRNGTIVINTAAIAASNGTASFFAVRTTNTGASSLFNGGEPVDEISVPTVTLDSYVAREGLDRIDVLKVDVEGAELLVFRGGERTLSAPSAPAIFFETDERLCASAGTTPTEVKRRLAGYGYGIFRWRRGVFSPVSIEEPHRHEDLFALKSRHLEALAA